MNSTLKTSHVFKGSVETSTTSQGCALTDAKEEVRLVNEADILVTWYCKGATLRSVQSFDEAFEEV